jgi:hypothetical protein
MIPQRLFRCAHPFVCSPFQATRVNIWVKMRELTKLPNCLFSAQKCPIIIFRILTSLEKCAGHKFVKRALGDVQIALDKIGKVLPIRVSTPMASGYRPFILMRKRSMVLSGMLSALRDSSAISTARVSPLQKIGVPSTRAGSWHELWLFKPSLS